MARKSLLNTLIDMGYPMQQAQDEINACRNDLFERIEMGEMPFDIIEEYFGLEPDYLDDLLY